VHAPKIRRVSSVKYLPHPDRGILSWCAVALCLSGCSHAASIDAIAERAKLAVRCHIVSPVDASTLGGGTVSEDEEPRKVWPGKLHAEVAGATSIETTLLLDGTVLDSQKVLEATRLKDIYFEDIPLKPGAHSLELRCSFANEHLSEQIKVTVDLSPCELQIVLPDADVQLKLADDAAPLLAGMQIMVDANVRGNDCEARFGVCPLPESALFTKNLSKRLVDLQSNTEPTDLCFEARDGTDNLVKAKRSVSFRDCSDSNQTDACGASCKPCIDSVPENAEPVCDSGQCSFRCKDNYHWELGTCQFRPGCAGLDHNCGDEDCCAVDMVGSEGAEPLQFRRGYDASDKGELILGWQSRQTMPVQVNDFQLDRFEVTVARFRKFLFKYDDWWNNGSGIREGMGAHELLPNSGFRAVWLGLEGTRPTGTGKERLFPASSEEFKRRITEQCEGASWTHDPAANEALPINCITFFEAFLFCIWDSGRLPTEAEWNMAAAGGDEQRAFPWSLPAANSTAVDEQHAVYDRNGAEGPLPVHSAPEGRGRWKTEDLAGSVWEWVRDTGCVEEKAMDPSCPFTDARDATLKYLGNSLDPLVLNYDADGVKLGADTPHFTRGGSYKIDRTDVIQLRTFVRQLRSPLLRMNDTGVRCARPGFGS
jgi:formylglycine-generating enzyme